MFFKRGPSPHQTSLAMIGARTGDQVLFLGRDRPALAAELALVTGLNGRTLVVAPIALQPQFDAAAAKAGSLVEVATHDSGPLPVVDQHFDVVVWAAELAALPESERTSRMHELLTLVRPGGRVAILDGVPMPRRFGGSRATQLPSDAVVALLKSAGAVAARPLGSAGGLNYYEARRTR